MTVYPVTIHGRRRWRLSATVGGKRLVRSFKTKTEAEAEEANLRDLRRSSGDVWVSMSVAERLAITQVAEEARQAGVTLAEVWAHWKASGRPSGPQPTLSQGIDALLDSKAKSGKSRSYVKALSWTLRSFAKGRDGLILSGVTLPLIEAWMDSQNLQSRSTVRSRLSTLFRFAIRRGWMQHNPCDRLEHVAAPKQPPAVFTPAQVRNALDWFHRHPRGFAWFVLTTLCGLRPEEAAQTTWESIDLNGGLVRVEAQTSKIRQRRVVYPLPSAIAWLKRALDCKSELPLNATAQRRILRQLRDVLGFAKWPKDITRHSAASYWLAAEPDAAKVALMLGNSPGILLRHYRALVTREQAEEVWGLAVTR